MSQRSTRGYLCPPLSRRRLLGAGATVAAGLLAGGLAACSPAPAPEPPTPTPGLRPVPPTPTAALPSARRFSTGSHYATIALAEVDTSLDPQVMEDRLLQLKGENARVLAGFADLDAWLDDAEREELLLEAERVAREAQRNGLTVFWYLPSLEVPNAERAKNPALAKAHADWLQVPLNAGASPYAGGVVIRDPSGDESAWVSPNSPWRDQYLRMVRALAQSHADGVWVGKPQYYSSTGVWCDASPAARAAFRAETGLDLPGSEQWDDPNWRRWIEWRHRNLARFVADVAAAGTAAQPAFETFVEIDTCDTADATPSGLDGAYLRPLDGVAPVWDVPTLSDSDGMRYAREDDWVCLISMYKYAAGVSRGKPAWALVKGVREDDTTLVLAEALAAGCNPCEMKVPNKTSSVGAAIRTRLYGFVAANDEWLFDARSRATIALWHSAASRDYAEPTEGSGWFATTTQPAGVAEWWSTEPLDSCHQKRWLGEYRGVVKALLHAHLPFDVLPSPGLRAEDLRPYKVLVAPDLQAIGDDEAALIRQFVNSGGTLVITGSNPTGLNEYGDARPDYALADVLGFHADDDASAVQRGRFGSGGVVAIAALVGKQYLDGDDAAAYDALVAAITPAAQPTVTTDADRRVHLEVTGRGDHTLLHFTNFLGVDGAFRVVPTRFTVAAAGPASKQVQAVAVAAPEADSPDWQSLPFTTSDGKAQFELSLQQYALVRVTWA